MVSYRLEGIFEAIARKFICETQLSGLSQKFLSAHRLTKEITIEISIYLEDNPMVFASQAFSI